MSALDARGARTAVTGAALTGYLGSDLHSNTVLAENASKVITDALGYDAWGERIASTTSALPTPWRYQGRLDVGPEVRTPGLWSPPATIGPMEIMGIRIPTVVSDNVALRCDDCLEVIEGTPWRINVLDAVATETPVSWAGRPLLNPGPFQFHRDPAHVRSWMRARRWLFCRRGEVREIMRPISIPGNEVRWGLCDGNHRDDHEFVQA